MSQAADGRDSDLNMCVHLGNTGVLPLGLECVPE